MHWSANNPRLVLGCHHKTGSVLLIQLMERLIPRLRHKGRLSQPVSGSPIDRKAPLSGILDHFRTCDCYFNMWFEHEIDVPLDSIRLVHFVRHPVKWIRSAYLYHKKGAPSDGIRWLDWQIFRVNGKHLSYCELLNHFDARTGLAVEAVRSFPEIIGTARSARTSARLTHRLQLSLEQVHENFGSAISRFCGFVGFSGTESERLVEEFKDLDLTQTRQGAAPVNVTRDAPDTPNLEHILEQDCSFRRLYSQAGEDMGFPFDANDSQVSPMLPKAIVNALLEGVPEFGTHWQMAERAKDFMRVEDANKWWPAYVLQTLGCGHLMMQSFIQQVIDAVE